MCTKLPKKNFLIKVRERKDAIVNEFLRDNQRLLLIFPFRKKEGVIDLSIIKKQNDSDVSSTDQMEETNATKRKGLKKNVLFIEHSSLSLSLSLSVVS
jgi:hypothetical protein